MFLPPNETTPLITVNGSLKLCLIVKAGFRRRTLSPRPSNSAALSVGRVADAVIAGLSLAVTLPLMIIVAIAIRLDSPGPVFECEDSIGRCGRRFRTLQFRILVHAPGQPASRPDLTRVGAFLRYARMDSLPQLLNVLRGDMSIVEIDGRSPSFLE